MSGEVARGSVGDGVGATTGGERISYREPPGREVCHTYWPVSSLALSHEANLLLAAGSGLAVVAVARGVLRDATNADAPACACALSADGARAICAQRPAHVSLWAGVSDAAMRVALHTRRLFSFDSASVWISAGGDRAIAVLANESESEFFDYRWGVGAHAPAPPRRRKVRGCVSALSVSEPQGFAAIVVRRHGVHRVVVQRLDELGTENTLRSVPTRSTGVPAACIARNGPLVVVADDASVRLFGAADFDNSVLSWGDRDTFTNQPYEMLCAISDDGDLVVARNGPASFKVWSVPHRICIATLSSPRSENVTAVTIARASRTVVWAEGSRIYTADIDMPNAPAWLGAGETPSTPQFFGPSDRRVRFRHALAYSSGDSRAPLAPNPVFPASVFENPGAHSIFSPTTPSAPETQPISPVGFTHRSRRPSLFAPSSPPLSTTPRTPGAPGPSFTATRRPRRPGNRSVTFLVQDRTPSGPNYFAIHPTSNDDDEEEEELAFPLPNFAPPEPKLMDLDALSPESCVGNAPAANDGGVDKKKVLETATAIELSVGRIEKMLTHAVSPDVGSCKSGVERISKLHNAGAQRDKNILEELTKLSGFAQKLKECGSTEDETFCPICQDTVGKGEQVLQLPCEHIFHRDCMWPYILREARPRCPVCRASISKIFGLCLPTWKYRGDGSDKLICKKGFANTNDKKVPHSS